MTSYILARFKFPGSRVSLSTLKRVSLINNGHLRVSKPDGMRRIFITGESLLNMLSDTSVGKGA